MSNSTTYLVLVGGTEVARKSKKATAVDLAEGLRAENPTDEIVVQTGAGTVVHTVKVKGTHAKPWTRTDTNTLGLEVPAGYEVSYTRNRIGALIARAADKSGLLVITEKKTYPVKNTVEAREVTNKLAEQHRTRRAAEKEKAAQAKAEAKAKREQEKKDAAVPAA